MRTLQADLVGPLPFAYGRTGHCQHGLCRNGVLTLPNGATVPYAQPTRGDCYRIDVPGFVPPADAGLPAEQAAGHWWLSYALFAGGNLYGQPLYAGWNPDATVFMSFGTGRNLAICFNRVVGKVQWRHWPSGEVVNGPALGFDGIGYWRRVSLNGHRAVFIGGETQFQVEVVGQLLWRTPVQFVELSVSWPAGGSPQFILAPLAADDGHPAQFDAFSYDRAVWVDLGDTGKGLRMESATAPAVPWGSTYGMTASGLATWPGGENVTLYYPHDHTFSKVIGFAYRAGQPVAVSVTARSRLTQSYSISVLESLPDGAIRRVRIANAAHRTVTAALKIDGVAIMERSWGKDVWNSWVESSDGFNADHDAHGAPVTGGGALNAGDTAFPWVGGYQLTQDLFVALWQETPSLCRWRLIDIDGGQHGEGDLPGNWFGSLVDHLEPPLVASRHPVDGRVAVDVGEGLRPPPGLCWV